MTRLSTSSVPRLLASGHEQTTQPAGRAVLGRLLGAIAQWREHTHDRRLLATLNEHMLRDIGIDPAPTESDGMAWFWRLR